MKLDFKLDRKENEITSKFIIGHGRWAKENAK